MKNIRTLLFATLLLALASVSYAQSVGINSDGSAPNSSAMLDVKSLTTGFLAPRMTESQKNAIDSPATGLLIFQTNETPGFYYYNGSSWSLVGTGSGSETDPVFGASAASEITGTNISNWNSAYDWGNHASAGYLTTYTETDPVFGASAAFGISASDITNWNALESSQWTTTGSDIYYNSGNVGIGTAAPSSKLQINDGTVTNGTNTQFAIYGGRTNTTNAEYANIFFGERSDGAGAGAKISAFTGNNNYETDLAFSTSKNVGGSSGLTEAMRINESGNVGIGTTTPAYKLDVAGSINGTSVFVNGVAVASSTDTYWSTAGSGKIYYSGGNVGVGTATPAYPLDVTGDVNVTGTFRINGTAMSGTGTVTSVSAGNGMDFTAVTTSGSVALGTPSTIISATTNSVSGTTHSHAVTTQLPSSSTAGVMLQSGAKTSGGFYGGTTAPTNTTRTNYDGCLYATKFYGDGSGLTGIAASTTTTNLAGGVAGSIPWQSAAGTTGFTAAGTSGYLLKSNGTTAPTWLQTIPVANGGTGTATAPTQYGVVYASTTSAYASTEAGTAGQVLTSNGTSAPTWSSNIGGTAATATNLAGGAAGTIPWQSTAGTTGFTAAGTSGYLLKSNGTSAPTWLQTIPVANGGTGATSATVQGGVVYGSSTTAMASTAAGTTGQVLTSNGTSAPTWSGNIGGNATTATTATNLAGGSAGTVPYQSAAGTTAQLATGTSGQVLTSNGAAAPSWTSAATPAGVVQQYAGAAAPTGYLLCQGQAVSRTTYAALFAVVSTTYGAGDGSTTFNVPNLQGKIPVGLNSADLSFDTRGETGGEKTHAIATTELPSHNHTFTGTAHSHTVDPDAFTTVSTGAHTHTVSAASDDLWANYRGTSNNGLSTGSETYTSSSDGAHTHSINVPSTTSSSTTATGSISNTGSGTAMNVLQPYIVLYYIIKY